MIRRIFSPTGATVLFLILSTLVVCGLSWVTVASLQVESAQREATLTADRATKERLALWRMDGFVLPAYGIETNRPFAHYSALHTAYLAVDVDFNNDPANSNWLRLPSPLLSVDLPPWMALHFQVDPEIGWESPQVIPQELYERLTNGPQWLVCQNVTPQRQLLLNRLKQQFDKETVLSLFVHSERNTTDDDLFLLPALMPAEPSTPKPGDSSPYSELKLGGPPNEDVHRRDQVRSSGKDRQKVEPGSQAGYARQLLPSPQLIFDRVEFLQQRGTAFPVENPADSVPHQSVYGGMASPAAAMPGGVGGFGGLQAAMGPGSPAGSGLGAGRVANTANTTGTTGNFSQIPSIKGDPAYDKRDEVAKAISRGNVENVPNSRLVGPLQEKMNPSAAMRTAPPAPTSTPSSAGDSVPKPGGRDGHTADLKNRPTPLAAGDSPGLPLASAPSAAASLSASNPDAKPAKSATLQPEPNTAQPTMSSPVTSPKETETREARKDTVRPPQPNSEVALETKKNEPLNTTPAGRSMAGGFLGNNNDRPSEQQATAGRAIHPLAGLGYVAGDRKSPASNQPMAVHVGPLRSQWLIAPDGTSYLVLIRAARLESKTIFQGILLDWLQVQERLGSLVADLFPAASFKPIFPGDTPNPERAMSILPVQLDPGPMPELPPAGWTPLRIGLLLAWLAAIIALLAVGFGGRALLDLSERRIRFVSAVTHELRTPLTSLRLYLDLLTSGMIEDPTKQKDYLTTLATESERLNRLIENVLDFARLEKRSVQAQCHPVQVEELIEQVRQTWADRCAAEGRELVIVSTVSLGQQLVTDTRMTLQILGNLIDNSRKYSRDSAEPRIWLWIKPGERGKVVFEVEDRGPGVPASERGTIFRPFRRGHEADTVAGGAGLGLALAKQWAEMLGGTLSYRTPEGGIGACFRLELPGQPQAPRATG